MIRRIQPIIVAALVLMFLAPFMLPVPKAQALIPGIAGTTAQCIAYASATNLLSNLLGHARGAISGAINAALNYIDPSGTLAKVFGGGNQKTEENGALRDKELFMDPFTRCVVRRIFDSTVEGMLNVVRTQGRDGGPARVQNWRNFQTNAQYRGENVFRAILANTQVCNYLRQSVNGAFGVTTRMRVPLTGQNIRVGSLDPYTLRARCSMPSNFNPQTFSQNFSQGGGWQAYYQLLQPQNNYYGLYLSSLDELNKQRQLELESDLRSVEDGYLPIYGATARDSCAVPGFSGRCLFYRNIKTAVGYVSAVATSTINQELAWLTNTDEISEIIVNSVVSRLIARLTSFDSPDQPDDYNINRDLASAAPRPSPYCPKNPTDPFCQARATPRPGGSTGPTPSGGGSCQRDSSGCIVNTAGNSCINGDFRGDVAGAIDSVIAGNPSWFDQSSPPFIQGGNEDNYVNAVVSALNGGGLQAVRESFDEIAVKSSGGGYSENYDILTSGGQVRYFHAATCEPPSF